MKHLLRQCILILVRILGLPFVLRARMNKREPDQTLRILLMRPDHLGDMILVTPILDAIRQQVPTANITMLVGPWSRVIVERHPAISRVLTCSFPGFQRASQSALAPYKLLFTFARQLRQEQYDLAINLRSDFWWGAALLYLAGIPRRVGYALAPGQPFLTNALPFAEHEHATISNLRLVSEGLHLLGYKKLEEPFTPERYPLAFQPLLEEKQQITQRLIEHGIGTTTPLAVIHPGTGGAVKLWRSDGWIAIAQRLQAGSLTGQAMRIILTGGPQEQALVEEIAAQLTPRPIVITDNTVGQLAALLARAQLVLGVDSGPLHLATAQDTPTLRIYGPTDARIFGPWGNSKHHRVITSTQRCASCPVIPCGRLDFRPDELADHPCVRVISNQQVEEAITTLLETSPKTPSS